MSSSSENKEFIIRYLAAVSGKPKSESLLREYIDDEDLIKHALASEISFPEYEIIPIDTLAEGDLVAVRGRFVGSHLGPFMGFPPTGKKIDMEFFVNYRIANGKIVDHWMIMDSAEMLRQLGIEMVVQANHS
jgi:predicted SnoaL-like aldol condensation-catalyzing enzyme